jgi:hypothetical protein
MRSLSTNIVVRILVCLIAASFLSGAGLLFNGSVSAAEILNRSIEMSDSTTGAQNVGYNISFTLATSGALGSISIEFCSNSTFDTDPCDAPAGMSVSNAHLSSQSGISGFTLSTPNQNLLLLSRASTVTTAIPVGFVFSNITNPSDAGSDYVRIDTYASNNGTGPVTDLGGLAFSINNAVNVSATVPPYLLFCAGNSIQAFDCDTSSGNYLDLGGFSSTNTITGTNQLVAATNGQNGYNITVNGTTLESGNNTLAALTAPSSAQVGVNQFGINLRANTSPSSGSNPTGPGVGIPASDYNTPNEFKYNSGDVIASAPNADDYRKYTITYMVNIKQGDPVGVYSSTFTYIALANF